jgi:hypothetical protein
MNLGMIASPGEVVKRSNEPTERLSTVPRSGAETDIMTDTRDAVA